MIRSQPATDSYRTGWDLVFGKKVNAKHMQVPTCPNCGRLMERDDMKCVWVCPHSNCGYKIRG